MYWPNVEPLHTPDQSPVQDECTLWESSLGLLPDISHQFDTSHELASSCLLLNRKKYILSTGSFNKMFYAF
jgi:hypothetical protein